VSADRFVLTLWTDDPVLAGHADLAGVDRVGLDLETHGKRERQAGLGTWISTHDIERLAEIGAALARAELFARVNPVCESSTAEVQRVLDLGARVLMLPMFHSAEEVRRFVDIVAGRATVVLLLETREAAEDIERICAVESVGEVHVGINDLALSLGLRNRFAVLGSELIARVSRSVREAGLPFGIGGIGRVDDTTLPIAPDLIYAQYPRLGATAALISRAFIRAGGERGRLREDIAESRVRLARWDAAGPRAQQRALRELRAAVERVGIW
jgi:2-keto-3-deoxy-L-rhamnonate aldolase RhmA